GLADATCTVHITSSAQVSSHILLAVVGTDAEGAQWALTGPSGGTLTLDLPAAGPGGSASATLVLTAANSNLTDLLGHLPHLTAVTGNADVGSFGSTATVRSSDSFSAHM